MDRTLTRRGLILLSTPVILLIVLRKPWVQLTLVALLYANADSLLSVKPYSFVELVGFFVDNIEATIGFVGLIVAFAAGKGFVESKQLDLKLALEAELGELIAGGGKSILACRMAAESMVEVETLARIAVIEASIANITPVVFPVRVEGAYHTLLRRSLDLPEAQAGLDPLLNRFADIERKWGPLLRSHLIASVALEKAKAALSAVSRAATLLEPKQDWPIEEFLVRQEQHWGTPAEDFIEVAKANESRFHAWMGAASGMGSSSIFRPSVLITTRLWLRLLKMRE